MGIAGSIKEIAIVDLIQQNCLDRKKSKLTIQYMDWQAILYFNDGSVVDAIMGDISGEEVIYKILEWEDGTFLIEKNVDAPRRTIENSWAGLILEGARRLDEKHNNNSSTDPKDQSKEKDKNMNAKLLGKVVEVLKEDLGEGLVASDVFTTADGQSLAGYNSNPKACALFNEITKYLHKSLKGSGFPGLGGYYMVHLENNMVVVVISHGEVQNGMLVDLSKTTMGLLLNVALPKAIATVEEAMK
jgi:hypothetical protein